MVYFFCFALCLHKLVYFVGVSVSRRFIGTAVLIAEAGF